MNTQPKRSYPWQRRRRKAVVVVILFCGLVLTPWFVYRWTQANRLQQAVDAVHAVGLPASRQELENTQPPPAAPDKALSGKTAPEGTPQVAEETVASTFPELVPSTSGPLDRPTLKSALAEVQQTQEGSPLGKDVCDQLRARLSERAGELQALHAMARKAPGRFPVKYLPLSVSEQRDWEDFRRLATAIDILQAEIFLAAEEGDAAKASEAILAGMNITETVRNDPSEHMIYARTSAHRTMLRALGQAVSACSFSDAQLAEVQAAFRQAEAPDVLRTGLTAWHKSALQHLETNPDYFYSYSAQSPAGPLDEYVPGATALLMQGAKVLGNNVEEKARYMEAIGRVFAATQRPTHELYQVLKDLEPSRYRSTPLLPRTSDLMIDQFSWLVKQYLEDLVDVRVAVVACAVERYRLISGYAPEHLDALVPAFLPEIPPDPVDGKPLRYVQTKTGYVIYGIKTWRRDNTAGPPERTTLREAGMGALRVTHRTGNRPS
jgi:hypothetical protein